MTALAFDTHKAAKALREAGADELLAEAGVATVGDAMGGNVATKADLAELEARLSRHLWAMAAGIVGLTVSLTVALVKLTSCLGRVISSRG